MRKLKQTKRFLVLTLIGIFIFSCNKDENFDVSESVIQSENFVTMEDAADIGSFVQYPVIGNLNISTTTKTIKSKKVSKSIESVTEIPDDNGNVISYIVNYSNGGFMMISADNRLNPILAYSESNSFAVDENMYPVGLKTWLNDTEDSIKKIRRMNFVQKPEVKQRWICY